MTNPLNRQTVEATEDVYSELQRLTPEYIELEKAVKAHQIKVSRIRRKKGVNLHTGEIVRDEPDADTVAHGKTLIVKRDSVFHEAVILARKLPTRRLETLARNAPVVIKKIAKEALRTQKTTAVIVNIPSPAHDLFLHMGVDVVQVCTEVLKEKYKEACEQYRKENADEVG